MSDLLMLLPLFALLTRVDLTAALFITTHNNPFDEATTTHWRSMTIIEAN